MYKMQRPKCGDVTKSPVLEVVIEYLDTFNVEGQSKSGDADTMHELDDGTYYVDEKGDYFYQANQVPGTLPDQEHTIEIKRNILNTLENQVTLINADVSETYVLILQQPYELKNILSPIQQECQEIETDDDDSVYEFSNNTEAEPEVTTGNENPKSTLKIEKKQCNYQCSYCTYSSPRKYLLARHMRIHSEMRPHQCSICERGFKTLASLQNHVNTHTGAKPYPCEYCEKSFTTSGELVRHKRYMHTHEKPHKCMECDYASVELSKMRRHMRCHTGERPYQCLHCTYAACDSFKLKRHLRTHTGEKPFTCDICSMTFTQSNSLKNHKLTHNFRDKPMHQCELCPTTCGRRSDLRAHVQKLHMSDVPHQCNICNKTFPDKYSIKLHKRTHVGEKCFKCEICPYASATSRHLATHVLIHTNEKPFACTECSQMFRQKQLLRRHFNIYHNRNYKPPVRKDKCFVCTQCQKEYANRGNLIRHSSTHEPDCSSDIYKALELKLGRTKKIVLKSHCQSYGKIETESEDDEASLEKVDQGYAVLEVLGIDGGSEKQQVAIVAESNYKTVGRDLFSQKKTSRNIDFKEEVDTCFGFQEDD